jgi:hypothetical protein
MAQQEENWSALKEAARRAGFQVDDDGASVQFARGRKQGAFVRNTRPAKVTGYQAAQQWLQRCGVQV